MIVHREWLPAGASRGTLVVVHGINEHGGRYEHLARRLGGSGWTVGAADHRGHGLSEGRRAAVESYRDWIDDLGTYVREVLAGSPRPLVMLGHSLGGLIATLYALRWPGSLEALVLSSPAVHPHRVAPALLAAGRLASRWTANLPLVPLDLDGLSRDPAVIQDYRDDPLVHRGRVRARTAMEILRATRIVERDIAELRLPLLVVQGTADRLVDPAAARWVCEHAGSADCTVQLHDGLFHEVLNEPERERILDDLERWLDTRCALPAGTASSA